MNIDKRIEDLRKEFDNKIDQLKKEYQREKNGKWIPNYGEDYYFLDAQLFVNKYCRKRNVYNAIILKYSKVFKTAREAAEYSEYLKARKKYSYEFSKEEWADTHISKYYIYYDYCGNFLSYDLAKSFRYINQVYFKSIEDAKEFIDKYKKQILKFEFDIEE